MFIDAKNKCIIISKFYLINRIIIALQYRFIALLSYIFFSQYIIARNHCYTALANQPYNYKNRPRSRIDLYTLFVHPMHAVHKFLIIHLSIPMFRQTIKFLIT